MRSEGRVFLDTNVLVYAFDAGEPRKRGIAQRILEETANAGVAVLSTQVLQEFYVIVTRKLDPPLSGSDAEEAVVHLACLPCERIDTDMVIAAVRSARSHGISLWDSLILHAAARAGCSTVLTEDLQDGFVLEGVRVRNPFADTHPPVEERKPV